MKLNLTIAYHYILFLGIALLLAPATTIRPCGKSNEIKIEKNKNQTAGIENSSDLLHGEMLFRY